MRDKKIKEIVQREPKAQLLMTIPGVGPITALKYLIEVGDPKRFKSSRAVGAYLGLTPKQYSSGETQKQGKISKCGSKDLRSLLVEAAFIRNDADKEYSVDSFPVSCCEKNRIDQRRIFLQKNYIGYAPSKKRYFCGIKVQMVVTKDGKPVEFQFRPGSESDLNVLWQLELDIPTNAKLFADGAYNCFELEDIFSDQGIRFYPKRGCNSKNRK